MICTELISDLIAVYPVSAAGRYVNPIPSRVVRASVSASSLFHTGAEDFFQSLLKEPGLVAESYCNSDAPTGTLEIMDFPTLKVTPKNNVAGQYFEVSISAKSIQMVDDVRKFFLRLDEYLVTDLYLLDSDGNWYLVRGMERATDFSVNYKLPNIDAHEITITASNVNGVQRIVFDPQ